MPLWLTLCDLGVSGWGEPWFPHSVVLLRLLTSCVWRFFGFLFLVFVFGSSAIPILRMIQCYHLSVSY